MRQTILFVLIILPGLLIGQVGITFTFGPGSITSNAGVSYYEFDVFVQGSAEGTRLGTGIVLLEYNTAAFGDLIGPENNNTVTVTKGSLISSPFYSLTLNDFDYSIFAVTFIFPFNFEGYGAPLPTTPAQLLHYKIEIANSSADTGLSFYWEMNNQQYWDNQATIYNPVEVTDELDETLPVELSSFTANMNNSLTGVNLTWVTQSESNLVGYGIFRGETAEISEAIDLNAFIDATNTSQTQVYLYTDETVMSEQTYWYWLESREMNGISETHGPICMTIPQQPNQTPQIPIATGLVSLYPNPFNPDLGIRFALEQSGPVRLEVVNIKGQTIRHLINETKTAGTHSVKWDGTDSFGVPCASGLYLIRMQAGARSSCSKVMLMK